MAGVPTNLRSLPFPEQIAAIDAALGSVGSDGAPALVAMLADFRDHQPLAYALGALARQGGLDQIADEVAARAMSLPDTGLRRVLRALQNTSASQPIVAALATAAGKLPVERIAAAAMLDRWIKNVAPAMRTPLITEAVLACHRLIRQGRPADVNDATLIRVPGTEYAPLMAEAERHGISAQWDDRVSRFAHAVLDALEAQPKSLSQANAEELLARQVYTDPGHFLIELLQNADDAGATVWRVRVESDRVEIEHDGVPFDARDVVGILSIGQTTKSKEQIGFFGVGFKSVYDICERPQIYSGPFAFEIANVSIPRPLTARAELAPGHTLLVLPLREPDDTERTPERLFDRLSSLPGEVLLTLNSLREIDVVFGARRHRITVTTEDDNRVRLSEQDHSRRFLIEHAEVSYVGARDANRAQSTPLLLAIPLDTDGRPESIGGRPTVYSYLPTRERSGLRFLIHAHFDVPVDRERLDVSSAWNRWAIGAMAPLLSRAIGRLADEWKRAADRTLPSARLDAAIDIVSLPNELGAEAYGAITEQLGTVAFLPGANSERLAASDSLIATDPRLVQALAGVDINGRRVLRGLDQRAEAVARTLGAVSLDMESVVTLLQSDAARRGAGAHFDAPWCDDIAHLAAVVGSSSADISALEGAACLPDLHNVARRPRNMVRAQGELRLLLEPFHPLVREDLEAAACGEFLDRLNISVATTRDLVAALTSSENARKLVDAVGIERVLRHLANAQPTELEGVELAQLAQTESGELGAIGEAFLTGDSSLAALVRNATVRPPLVSRELEASCAAELTTLGCPRLDLRAAIELLKRDQLRLGPDQIAAFHRAIDAQRDSISPALAAFIARAPIFPSTKGSLRALHGPDRALVPADDDIRSIWPDRPWLSAEVASIEYIRSLGVQPVGASEVARDLLRQPPADQMRRAAFAYLAKHPETLRTDLHAALANAALWPDIDGSLRTLDTLRRPGSLPVVARLYELWPRATTIEAGDRPGTAMHLATALDLAHHVIAPDLSTAIDDITAGSGELDVEEEALSQAVTAVLLAAAAELPRARLDRVREAAIFRCTDGVRRRLGSWASPDSDRAHRVSPALQTAFAHGRFPLLAHDESSLLADFLDALTLPPGNVADLVRSVDGDLEQVDASTATTLRRAMVGLRHELHAQPDEVTDRLAGLPIWPTSSGFVAARCALRSSSLEELVGEYAGAWAAQMGSEWLGVIAPEADADAAALADALPFAIAAEALATTVDRVAVDDAPLAQQPEALRTIESVAAVSIALVPRLDDPWSHPIAVSAAGCLVRAELLLATTDELNVGQGLPIYARFAEPGWAALVVAAQPHQLTPMTPRQFVGAIRAASPEPCAPEKHPSLFDADRRRRLYDWLLLHHDAIAGDDQARGALGKSCFVLSENGMLRAPHELLFDADLPNLGIDWNPAGEVPAPLCSWLRDTYRAGSKQLRPLVDHLIGAIDEAVAVADSDRVAELVHHLAGILRADEDGEELSERVRHFRLRKRLRIESSAGGFERPRTLLAPDARDSDLLARFADPLPATVASRYRDQRSLRLFRASGAERELGAAAMHGYIRGANRRPGADSAVALACYIASAASRVPSLRRELQLQRRKWVPDRRGNTHEAADLYWPGDGVGDLVGELADQLVHPELAHRAPEAAEWIGTRTAASAALPDVAAHLATLADSGSSASETVLFWLNEGLANGSLKAEQVRHALSKLRIFDDDLGRKRRADELVIQGARRLFGERRGDWAAGARVPRLASALRIPLRPGKREVVIFLERIAARLSVEQGVARDDSDLVRLLPRCLDLLVEAGGRGPSRLPVVCRDAEGTVVALLPKVARLVGFSGDDEPCELMVLLAEGAVQDAWRAYLRAYGVGAAQVSVEPQHVDPEDHAPVPAPRLKDQSEEPDQPDDTDRTGIISRFRRWLRNDDDEPERPDPDRDDSSDDSSDNDNDNRGTRAPSPTPRRRSRPPRRPDPEPDNDSSRPFQRVDQRAWFRSNDHLGSQLDSNPAWLADRMQTAEFGLAHAPTLLPLPYRYGPQAMFGAFDRDRQSWSRLRQDPGWSLGGGTAGRVQLRGRLPAGEAIIPLPLYGRVASHNQDDTTRFVETPDGTVAISRSDVVISIAIELHQAPDFNGARTTDSAPAELYTSTVSDQEMPVEIHDLVASLTGEPNALVVAETLRAFVCERYVYDPTYLENPEVAAWLKQRTHKRSNIHVAALHAGRDTDHLGRGVCYELNTLLCELLRRCGIPCAVAKGWTFDRGYIDEPDHLWAMALLDAGAGPRWIPLDASTTRTGRPLHAANRPPGRWNANTRAARAPREPEWAKHAPNRRRAKPIPISDLLRVARYIEQVTDTHLGTRAELLAACRALLSDPESAARLATIIAGMDRHDSD